MIGLFWCAVFCFNEEVIDKCWASTDGCSIETYADAYLNGTIPIELITQYIQYAQGIVAQYINLDIPIGSLIPESTATVILPYLKLAADDINLLSSLFGSSEVGLILPILYNNIISNKEKISQIAATKIFTKQDVLDFMNTFPTSFSGLTNRKIANILNIPITEVMVMSKSLASSIENNSTILHVIEVLTGIPEADIKELVDLILSPLMNNKLNEKVFNSIVSGVTNLETSIKTKNPMVIEIKNWKESFLKSLAEFPKVADIVTSIDQLMDSFNNHREDWTSLFGYAPSAEIITQVKTVIADIVKNGVSFQSILAQLIGSEEVANQMITIFEEGFKTTSTIEKLIATFGGQSYVTIYKTALVILSNEQMLIGNIVETLKIYIPNITDYYALVKVTINEIAGQVSIQNYTVFQYFQVSQVIDEFLTGIQHNFSTIYDATIPIGETLGLSNETITEIIEIIESDIPINTLFDSINMSGYLPTFIEEVTIVVTLIDQLYAKIPVPALQTYVNMLNSLYKGILQIAVAVNESDLSIKQTFSILPFENASMIYPIIQRVAKALSETTSIKSVVDDIMTNIGSPFDFEALFNGFIEMKVFSVQNICELFIHNETTKAEFEAMLAKFAAFGSSLDSLTIGSVTSAIGLTPTIIAKFNEYSTAVLQFQYVDQINQVLPSVGKTLIAVGNTASNAQKKYTLEEIDTALDTMIEEATGVERKKTTDNPKKNNTVGIAIGVVVGVVVIVAIVVAVIIIRKKKNSTDYDDPTTVRLSV